MKDGYLQVAIHGSRHGGLVKTNGEENGVAIS